MSTKAIPYSPPEIPLSQLGRVGRLFMQPSRLFRDVKSNTSWWLPFVLTVLCSYSMTFLCASKIGLRQLTENMLRAEPSLAQRMDESMTQDERDTVIETTETSFKISSYSVPALVLLYNVGYALVLLVGINVFAGGRADFRSIFAVLLYADLIQNVRSLLSIVILYLIPDPHQFNIQNAVGSNLGFYLAGPGSGGLVDAEWFRTLMSSMDIITVWYLFIIALGCSIVAKISRRSAIAVVFGLWFMVVIGRVMWAAIV